MNESLTNPEINLSPLDFEKLKNAEKIPIKRTAVKFEQILQARYKYLTENVCLTSKNQRMVLYYEGELYVINTELCQVLARENISSPQITMDYFLSPTNLNPTHLIKMTSIEETDLSIALNNLNNLVIINYIPGEGKILMCAILNEDGEPVRASSFKINSNALAYFDKFENKLTVVDLKSLLSTRRLKIKSKNVLYEIKLAKDAILAHYGLSEDNTYAFLVENKKLLRFYNLRTRREIAIIPMYSEIDNLKCNQDFISMSMQDNKVISFLINDPSRAGSYEKIRSLPSRSYIEANQEKAKELLTHGDSIMFKNHSTADKKFFTKVFTSNTPTDPADTQQFNMLKKSNYNTFFLSICQISKLSDSIYCIICVNC
jgi:hypothetical protein